VSSFATEVRRAWDARQKRAITVPEWNRTLYVFPLTIAQLAKIQAETDNYRRLARIVETRGKNEDGSPMFDSADFEELCAYGIGAFGIDIVARVAGEIMADHLPQEQIEKN
jgi:hypothetical protein